MRGALPDAEWRHRAGLDDLIATLGDTARYVGGAVRDGLLGVPVSDIDMATTLRPEQVIERLNAAGIKAVPTGIAHGTITAVTAGGPVEITTLRRDVSTNGRHATVAYTGDWQQDAARRDFTINALSADLLTGQVYDWFDGCADLELGVVRFIGEPLARIAEDHLRILRFFRFHARFGQGEPDAAAYDACALRANDLMALSRERIADELIKLLAVANPVPAVELMLTRQILKPVLPEIEDAAMLARLILREAEFNLPPNAIRRLAALIGARPQAATEIAKRLRLSNAKSRRLVMACTSDNAQPIAALAYRIGVESAVDRLLIGQGVAGDFAALSHWRKPKLPISGGALISRGVESGPEVSRTLARIEEMWIMAGFPTGAAFDVIVDGALPS
ncbi:CCA tRNA nucleotidyltransferase [Sphingomonas paeninsulae]|uniref:CCA tRNA nucleotidyltransferase n=1 Tax=Sphingomonas paeninsulae TaxID=2319844 RepID=A0A494TKV1_SPHPE|nr:CCA tRNA nucleotidyltransferase [Sphingomonas paeninsulae]AYJ86048.1 CCA tRNA nucleotidyltransferase [Sphingomonas paeninsulae]